MFTSLVHAIGAPLLEGWMASAVQARGRLPVPSDEPHVYAMGADPDRILLVGGSAACDLGVTSHELGLGGHLARQLSALTGRGADVEIRADQLMNGTACTKMLEATDLSRYDALVVMLGSRESVGMLPAEGWHRELRAVLDLLEKRASSLAVLIVGIPPVSRILSIPGLAGRMIARHRIRLDAVTCTLCSFYPQMNYVPFDTGEVDLLEHLDPVGTFDRWAGVLVEPLRQALGATVPGARLASAVDETERQLALDRLRVVSMDPDERFDRILTTACSLLGTPGGAIIFIERDGIRVKSAVGIQRTSLPRSFTFAGKSIDRDGLFVIEDVFAESEQDANPPRIGDDLIRFYAGFPIESPDGVRIGTLSVVDTQPRVFGRADGVLLREMALRTQQLVWSEARQPGKASEQPDRPRRATRR